MNQKRRLKLQGLYQKLISVFDMDDLAVCSETLLDILQEEEEYYDNIPYNLIESKRAKESEKAIELLNKADDAIFDAITLYEDFDILNITAQSAFRNKVLDATNCIVEILREDMAN